MKNVFRTKKVPVMVVIIGEDFKPKKTFVDGYKTEVPGICVNKASHHVEPGHHFYITHEKSGRWILDVHKKCVNKVLEDLKGFIDNQGADFNVSMTKLKRDKNTKGILKAYRHKIHGRSQDK